MAKIYTQGGKYYEIQSDLPQYGGGAGLTEISLADIRGRMGDKPAGFDFNTTLQQMTSGGEIVPLSNLFTSYEGGYASQSGEPATIQPHPDKPGYYQIGSSGVIVPQGFTYQNPTGLPQNTAFSNYLSETGQVYNPQTGFSGTLGQLNAVQPQQLASIETPSWVTQSQTNSTNQAIIDEAMSAKPNDQISSAAQQYRAYGTLPQTGVSGGATGQTGGSTGAREGDYVPGKGTLMPDGTYKPTRTGDTGGAGGAGGTGGASGYTRDAQRNVYNQSGQLMTLEQGKPNSLPLGPDGRPLMNLETLPLKEKSVAEKKADSGIVGTSEYDEERAARLKAIEASMKATNDWVQKFLTAFQPTEEITRLQKLEDDLMSSYEQGLVDIEGQPIAMQAIIGQSLQLEKQANVKINQVQRQLERLQDNQTAQQKALEAAYQITKDNVAQQIQFYQLTAPDKLYTDTENGKVYFQDSTGKITVKDLPGFIKQANDIIKSLILKYPDAGISEQDTLTTAQSKLKGSAIYQKETKGTSTESDSDIDTYVQDLLAGNITASNVPQNIRGRVIAKKSQLQKEGSLEELKTTIQENKQQGDYGTREELITALTDYYKGVLTKDEIANQVYGLIPDVQTKGGSGGGIINSISNWLFR